MTGLTDRPPAPVRAAVIGYGYGGRTLHVPLINKTRGMEVATVVTSDPSKVALDLPGMKTVRSPEEAFLDEAIDLVVVVTPNETHAPLAEQALRHGKHVVVDKPFTVRSADAWRLAKLADDCGTTLSVYQSRRWDADFLAVRQVMDSGTLGDISYFESRLDRYRPVVRDRWRERAEPGAGIWFDLGSHLIDQAHQLFGRPQAIFADIAAQRRGARADDYFHAILFYDSLRVVLHSTCLAVDDRTRFVLHGERGSYVKQGVDPQEAALQIRCVPGGADWGVDKQPGTLTSVDAPGISYNGPSGDYRRFYEGVRDAIRSGGPNPVPAEQGARVIEVIEAGIRSSSSKAVVSLDH